MEKSKTEILKKIFKSMKYSTRIKILKILILEGPQTYSDLKSTAGKPEKQNESFSLHVRKLLRYSLVSLNRSQRKYSATELGRTVLALSEIIEKK